MTPDDLCFMPASELAPLFRGKKLSPVELCEAVLARVERLEPQLNAFVVWDATPPWTRRGRPSRR